MKLSYKQKNKSKMWNLTNALKRLRKTGEATGVSIPKKWLNEFGWKYKDLVLLSIDQVNEKIIIQKANPEDYELPGDDKEIEVDDEEISESEPESD